MKQLLMLLPAYIVVACSSAELQAPKVEEGLTTCTTDYDCVDPAHPQYHPPKECGETHSCISNLCYYDLVSPIASGCNCLEGAQQTCSLGGTSVGVQLCSSVLSGGVPVGTVWGTCTSAYSGTIPGGYQRNCSGLSDCTNDPYLPVCIDFDLIDCANTGLSHNECMYRKIDADSNCPCIEGEIRYCGGSGGHQTCLKTHGYSGMYAYGATAWGSCT